MEMNDIYEIWESNGATTQIAAECMSEAVEYAIEWVSDAYYPKPQMVRVVVTNTRTGEEWDDEVQVGPEPEPPETECGSTDECHDWRSPKWLGGLAENPGVWDCGASNYCGTYVCAKCGIYKHWLIRGPQRNPGQLKEEIEYDLPDEQSLGWVRSRKGGKHESR